MRTILIAIIIIALGSYPAFAQEPFDRWLETLKSDALSDGISQETIDDALGGVTPIDRVIELDQKQPESLLTVDQYVANVVTKKRVSDGKRLLKENHTLLTKIGKKYGVQPRFIVALWGIETGYGKNTGGFHTIEALATLAYDGRRSDFFRGELMSALKILQVEEMASADMKGSWAGALGQCQFMPSSFLKYAVDYDGDGKRDIWGDKADVFASIANYLKTLGWNAKEGWGREVELPPGFDSSLADITRELPLSQWRKLGVRKADGKPLPALNTNASLAMVGKDDDAMPYIVYGNYKALLQWNRSRFFATAVGTLADRIGQ